MNTDRLVAILSLTYRVEECIQSILILVPAVRVFFIARLMSANLCAYLRFIEAMCIELLAASIFCS